MCHARVTGSFLIAACLFAIAVPVRAEVAVFGGGSISRDDQGYRWDQYQLELRREVPTDGQWLALRWHDYGLNEPVAGVLPFSGSEPSAGLGGHVFTDLWWLGGSAGFQGSADLQGVVGEAVIARALPGESLTLTPRLELAREPLTQTALPLSLGLIRHRAEALLAFRTTSWTGEGGGRIEFWEGASTPGRVQNAALGDIESNRILIGHGYVLSDWKHWVDLGFAAKLAWAQHNTMYLTDVQPVTYTWYPASAPPFTWETAAVVRLGDELADSFELNLQLQLPLLSQEVRQWETVRRRYWGTGAFEGALQASWAALDSTTLHLKGLVFAKPWENWDMFSRSAYRQWTAQLFVEQRI